MYLYIVPLSDPLFSHPPPCIGRYRTELLISQLQESSREKDGQILRMQAELDSLRSSLEQMRATDTKSPHSRRVVAMAYEVTVTTFRPIYIEGEIHIYR